MDELQRIFQEEVKARENLLENFERISFMVEHESYRNAIIAILVGLADIDTKISKQVGSNPALEKDDNAVYLDGQAIIEKHIGTGWIFNTADLS